MSAVLYIEGGGDNRRLGAQFREGWTSFFRRAGLGGCMPKVVRGGSREQTFVRFIKSLGDSKDGTVPLLLVDSEAPVTTGHTVWQHLHARDRWGTPDTACDDQAFLMVQVMETWFLADREALRVFFGPKFAVNAIREWPRLEDVPKNTVLDVLSKATAKCSKQYGKGKISFELLAHIDPAHVKAACPHAKSLLDRLRPS